MALQLQFISKLFKHNGCECTANRKAFPQLIEAVHERDGQYIYQS